MMKTKEDRAIDTALRVSKIALAAAVAVMLAKILVLVVECAREVIAQ